MHMCARSGNEGVLLAMVNKIGPGSVQIVQNKKSRVCTLYLLYIIFPCSYITIQNGWSPLLEACARGHVGVSKILLQHHARIDVFDDCGRTVLYHTIIN
jgi:ankyrin repeat protein